MHLWRVYAYLRVFGWFQVSGISRYLQFGEAGMANYSDSFTFESIPEISMPCWSAQAIGEKDFSAKARVGRGAKDEHRCWAHIAQLVSIGKMRCVCVCTSVWCSIFAEASPEQSSHRYGILWDGLSLELPRGLGIGSVLFLSDCSRKKCNYSVLCPPYNDYQLTL